MHRLLWYSDCSNDDIFAQREGWIREITYTDHNGFLFIIIIIIFIIFSISIIFIIVIIIIIIILT